MVPLHLTAHSFHEALELCQRVPCLKNILIKSLRIWYNFKKSKFYTIKQVHRKYIKRTPPKIYAYWNLLLIVPAAEFPCHPLQISVCIVYTIYYLMWGGRGLEFCKSLPKHPLWNLHSCLLNLNFLTPLRQVLNILKRLIITKEYTFVWF